jgi:hypothetical protein
MNRREFGIEAALLLLGGACITMSGCESPTEPSPVDVAGVVDSNHGHLVAISAAQLRAGGALELDIKGSAGHTHTVSLSTVDLALIRNGARVERESTGTRHTHRIVFQV